MRNKLLPTLCESVMGLRSKKQAATPKSITEYIWTTTSDASLRPDLNTVRKALKLAVRQGVLHRSRDGTYRISLKGPADDTVTPRRHRNHRTQRLDSVELRYRGHSKSHKRGAGRRRKHHRGSRRHRRRSHSRNRTYTYAELAPRATRHRKSHFDDNHLYGTYYFDY